MIKINQNHRHILTSLIFAFMCLVIATGCKTHPETNTSTAQVRVRITGLSGQASEASPVSDIPGFRINASTILLIIEAPNLPARVEQIPVETGEGIVTVSAGPNRTFRVEVDNQQDLLIYQSRPQTRHLVTGTTTTLHFTLQPIETIIPLSTSTQITSGRAAIVTPGDVETPMQGLRLSIPPHAVPQPITLRMSEIYNPAYIPSPATQASGLLALGPSEVILNRPAILTFPYSKSLLKILDVAEIHLRVSRFNPSQQEWVPLQHQIVDIKNKSIMAHIRRFGLYSLTVDTEPISNPSSVGVAQNKPKQITPPVRLAASQPRTLPWRDYRLTLSLQNNVEGAAGIIFRYQDANNYYRFVWALQRDVAQLVKHYQGRAIVLAEQTLPYRQDSYQVEVVAEGRELQVSIDSTLLFSVIDADIPAGSIALSCQDEQRICFTGVRVEGRVTHITRLESFVDRSLRSSG